MIMYICIFKSFGRKLEGKTLEKFIYVGTRLF